MPQAATILRRPPTVSAGSTADGASYPSLPPWLYQPVSGLPFNPTSYVALPAIGADATIVQYVVPAGQNGVIVQMGNNFVGGGFVDGSGSIIWRLLIDDAPYPNFGAIIASLGNPAAPSYIGSVRLFEKQKVQLIVRNVSIVVAGQLVGGRLSGWSYPRVLEPPATFF